jgi:hypothetical protein
MLATTKATHMNEAARRDQVESEARAKVIWGEDPDQALNFLRVNGFSDDEALAIVHDVLRERLSAVRSVGFRKMMIGLGMIAVPVVAYLVMKSAGVIFLKLLGVAIAVGLWGAWKVMQGSLMILFPSAEHGDIADQMD